jgi:hypothetical protein
MPDLESVRQALLPASDPAWWNSYFSYLRQRNAWLQQAREHRIPSAEHLPGLDEAAYKRFQQSVREEANQGYEFADKYQDLASKQSEAYWTAWHWLLHHYPQATRNLPAPSSNLLALDPEQVACAVREALGILADIQAEQAKQAPAKAKRHRGRPIAEVNEAVADYLLQNKHRRQAITAREIARHITASPATVSRTPAWKAFEKRRKQEGSAKPRTVPLSDAMLKAIPDGKSRSPDEEAELQRLIAEQEADLEADERPRKGRF